MKLFAILIVVMMNGEIHEKRWHDELYDGRLACDEALENMPRIPFTARFCKPMIGVYH